MRDVEIPNWLKGLPLAPEFHPTDTEFADPIAYISKIEKEASAFGICKVIPPFAKPAKKYVITNLNNSLSKCPELGSNVNLSSTSSLSKMHNGDKVNNGEVRAVFTTRHQELGQSGKRTKGAIHNPQPPPVHKQVWQSGEVYTLEQFESKSKTFAKTHLGMVKEVSPLVIETLFWQAASEKPIYVEYANDVPGSGFTEPEGPLRKFHRRRRRRRTFSRNGPVDSINKNDQSDILSNDGGKNGARGGSNSDSPEVSKAMTLPNILSDQTPTSSRHRNSNGGNEMERTNGWKLSNSPWNLQVIARAPGSLTRFMPDDIPGVTSPMVYIGMLFSWFAWHVEDHELHSLNFLHTGSQKTWYAVPGDYAFTFEETICKKAYGGNIDRLAALTLLGEKTTLLSPEVIVASGIPCCRLVQNPGEFVVTFPRAYHVGFSHGFNCGEAANFGTPKWLTVAKEAAVRRAAMNYLPMLSHQQLLYLLTMSFISRVPRALLPGVRSSRLRDRQKEEREMLVKKAFIEDLLNENNLLSILLRKNSKYHGVLWDLESLQSSIKESGLCSSIATIDTTPTQNNYSEKDDRKVDLYSEISMYMESMNNSYVDDDDDLSVSFQVDTGTLPCVACGVLGFPFMSIVQPSEKAAKGLLLLPGSQEMKLTNCGESHHVDVTSFSFEASDITIPNGASSTFQSAESSEDHRSQVPAGPDFSLSPKDIAEDKEGWNTSSGYLRPHIFCLEHAIQIEELLQSKGGANVLLICHSDFQKIKAHAAAVAEEIGSSFNYKEIPLDEASKEDLNLINLAIDNEEKDDYDEDWTSKLNINMRHCVKLRKVFPTEKEQHALTLCGLFSDSAPTSSPSSLNWKSKKFRSKRNLNPPHDSKPSESIPHEKEQVLGANLTKKEDKIIQYSRRIKRHNGSAGASKDPGDPRKLVPEESSAVCSADPNENSRNTPEACTGKCEMQDEYQGIVKTGDLTENSSVQSQVADPVIAMNPLIEIEAQMGKDTLEETFMKDDDDKVCNSTEEDEAELLHEVEVTDDSREKTNVCYSEISPQVTENIEIKGENQIAEEICMTSETSYPVTTGDDFEGRSSSIQANGDVSMEEVSDHANSSAGAVADEAAAAGVFDEKMEKSSVQSVNESKNNDGHVLGDGTLINETTTSVSMEEHLEAQRESSAADEMQSDGENCCLSMERKLDSSSSNPDVERKSSSASGRSKRKREVELQTEDQHGFDGFIKSPCEGLRPRTRKDATTRSGIDNEKKTVEEDKRAKKKSKNRSDNKKEKRRGSSPSSPCYSCCDIEGCRLKFKTKEELGLHKRNRCPNEGCGKKFRSHKYAVLHLRVHEDDRPLKCPWKGCKMTFKWAWARTEHVRVHTGERPYSCKVEGCGLTFRFVSDYSRHRRKTGHYVNIPS